MAKRKICVVTGSRAEYGLLYWLMKEIQEDLDLELQIIATGMHLSPEFGLTYRVIEEDGFNINAKVGILLSSDTADGDGNASSDILKRIKQQMSNPQLLINKRFFDLQ